MHIIHSGHLNVHSGGPALSTWLTIKGLREKGVDTDIVMPPIDPGDQLIDKAAKPIYYRQPKYGTLAYVPKYDETIKSIGDACPGSLDVAWNTACPICNETSEAIRSDVAGDVLSSGLGP